MKRLLLCFSLFFLAISCYAQNTIIGLYGGVGTSLTYNYDVGISGGLSFAKQFSGRTCIGASLFYQGYAFKYDNEAYGVKNGTGVAGVTILNKSSYVFVAPKLSQFFGYYNTLEAYVNVGAGFKMSGTETMRKWDRTHGSVPGNYDSTIDTSPNINSMLLRVGVGLTEYLHLGSKWWFTISEDFGFVPSSFTKTSDPHEPSRTIYSPNGKINPAYISVHIGISHTSRQHEKEAKVRKRNRYNW